MNQHDKPLRKPSWLKTRIPLGENFVKTRNIVESNSLHTICQSGLCPNMAECWEAGTATFLILGNVCTRSCKFCATLTGKPLPPDALEPQKIANAIAAMNLKHCVITSVDRDDLEDFGATHWGNTVLTIKEINPLTTIEALIPDFNGNHDLINIIINTAPSIISHNLETVERLTPQVRSKASYDTSLKVIHAIANSPVEAKSGIMVGLGESMDEILKTMDDLLQTGCKIMTIGQYLQPTRKHLPVVRYYHPDEFLQLAEIASRKGFRFIESAPLVRSSYHAEKHV